jgi:thiamine pyrophosphate-dependent acetolactate synthase large subunit-like protein
LDDHSRGAEWGSDAVAGFLSDLGFEYVALNPGASFRSLHDSIVNFTGNSTPKMIVCLHEEHTVAIAHGYAKVSGRPMLAAVHTSVGLMHASMAIFNAYCDRVPVVVLGAQGPLDAAQRRPWIDWLHTSADQAALVRPFLKWDDEPHSITAAAESLQRAAGLATQRPAGPTFVTFDSAMQERRLTEEERSLPRLRAMEVIEPIPDVGSLGAELAAARRPVLLIGRVDRSPEGWAARLALAETVGAHVVTDLRVGASFPTDHPLHIGPPGLALSDRARRTVAESDLVLALDWIDLAGAMKEAGPRDDSAAAVVSISPDAYVHNGWTKDHQGLFPLTRHILGSPDRVVNQLVTDVEAVLGDMPRSKPIRSATHPAVSLARDHHASDASDLDDQTTEPMTIRQLGIAVRRALQDCKTTYIRLPIGWPGDILNFREPLDYLGYDGGGGIGSGPGMAVGAALALKSTHRLPVAILGDGDFLMGCSAVWSAASEGVGLLILVSNNRSYFNDVLHQERVAKERERPTANRWIGQRIDDPAVDIAELSRAFGARGHGPISSPEALVTLIGDSIQPVIGGQVVVIDVAVRAEYDGIARGTITQHVPGTGRRQ